MSLVFDPSTRVFNYTYRPDPAIALPTEVFVPPLVYADGYLVDLSDGLSWTPDTSTNNNRQCFDSGDENHAPKLSPCLALYAIDNLQMH